MGPDPGPVDTSSACCEEPSVAPLGARFFIKHIHPWNKNYPWLETLAEYATTMSMLLPIAKVVAPKMVIGLLSTTYWVIPLSAIGGFAYLVQNRYDRIEEYNSEVGRKAANIKDNFIISNPILETAKISAWSLFYYLKNIAAVAGVAGGVAFLAQQQSRLPTV